MSVLPDSGQQPVEPSDLDKVVEEIVSETHVQAGSLGARSGSTSRTTR